jgi:hypothetical protein
MPKTPEQLSASGAEPDETPLGRFKAAWRRGERPEIGDALAGLVGEERMAHLIQLVQAELGWRLRAGEPARVEEYLLRFPELGLRPDLVVALVLAENRQRRRRQPDLSFDEYFVRFPQLRDELAAVAAEVTTQPVAAPPKGGGATAQQARGATRFSLPGYEVLSQLGRGGMGVVFKARDIRLNRLVAVKLIRAAVDGEEANSALARFRTEAEALARLRHENIVRIYSFGEHRGHPYLVLEYVEGGNLAALLGGKPLPPQRAAALTLKLARAVEHSHQYLIIHRDLKPANVLLTTEGEPKITDFGLARDLEGTRLTQSGAVLGTPNYMAPEQAAGEVRRVGPATDVYALGAMLYEMLTGRPPFQGQNMLEVLARVQTQQPPRPGSLNPEVPPPLETICLTCLRKAPGERYASASALAADLRNFLKRQPLKARDGADRANEVGVGMALLRGVMRLPGMILLGLFLLFATGLYQTIRGSPGFGFGLAAAVLVAIMASRARLVPLAAGAGGGLAIALVGSMAFLADLGLSPALAFGEWRVLYFSALGCGLASGMLVGGRWPKCLVLPTLLAVVMVCGLVYFDAANLLLGFTAAALWCAGVGRGAAAFWGGRVGSAVLGSLSGLYTAFLAYPIAFALAGFGVQIDGRFLTAFVAVFAVVGSVWGAVRSARIAHHVAGLLKERYPDEPGGERLP